MEIRDDVLVLDKPRNELDDLVLDVTEILSDAGVDYAVVSGYVAVLLGRSRATEDIDVIVDPFDEATGTALADALQDAGFWGPAMPLEQLYDTLADDLPIRVARADRRVPNVELKFATDEYDRAALDEQVTVRFSDAEFAIGSLELQIAYKLNMGAQRDYEDALYLYEMAKPSLNSRALEEYAERLGVVEEYDKLRGT
ncbi:hypothetical protein [Salinarchaeum laminariae]|uniref:hypothetical protein n=1 Tax=Salinarchaeum laminariae TaxID=869888 RepID=UPI0020BF8BF5|nr:hypothetical protein [Salinarchaeum laminariae]